MDELEISGKRYISTRRAGKDHKYHADYIGQLIRAKKVEGQKVGRSWYVDANSLAAYLGKEPAASMPVAEKVRVIEKPAEVVEVQAAPAKIEVEITAVVEEVLPVQVEEIKIAEVKEEKEILQDKENIEEHHIPVKITAEETPIYRTTKEAREARTGLRYIADDSALFPHIKKHAVGMVHNEVPVPVRIEKKEIEHQIPVAIKRVVEVSQEGVRPMHVPTPKVAVKKSKNFSIVLRGAVVLALGVVVFAVAAFGATHLLFTVTVDGGQSANAGYSVK